MTLSKEERQRRDEQRALERRLRGETFSIVERGTVEINPHNPNNPYGEPETTPLGEWMERELAKPAEPYLLQDLIMPGGLTVVAGRPKLGKSFLVLGGLIAMSSGKRNGFLNPIGVSPSLYFDIEGVARATAARAKGMCIAQGLHTGALDNVHMYEKRKLEVLTPGYSAKLVELVRATGARTVAIDTFAASFTGDENAKKDVQKYLNILSEVRHETGCAAILVHHVSKASFGYKETSTMMNPDNGLRGSSALQGAYDIIASLQDGWVEGRHLKAMILRGKYTPDSWLEFDVKADAPVQIGANEIVPFNLKFGHRHDDYAMFELPPSDKQPGFGGRR